MNTILFIVLCILFIMSLYHPYTVIFIINTLLIFAIFLNTREKNHIISLD